MTALLTSVSAEPPGGRPLFDDEFQGDPPRVAVLRAEVRARLRREACVPTAAVDATLSILGELVGNACVHAAGSRVRVMLALIDEVGILTGVVHDDGPGSIVLPGDTDDSHREPVRENGFGLRLVMALTETCGVRRTRDGKEVYFAVRW